MSWDVLLLDAPADRSMEELTDADVRPLGSVAAVHATLRRAWPDLDLSDPTWGRLDRLAIEVNIGSADPVESVMLHVRGGEDAVPAILELCRAGGWRAVDISTGDWLDTAEDPTEGLRGWRAFRDRAIRGTAKRSS